MKLAFNQESLIPAITHTQPQSVEASRVRNILENAFGENRQPDTTLQSAPETNL
jgi:hypothetical protein